MSKHAPAHFPSAPTYSQLEPIFKEIRKTGRPENVKEICWTRPIREARHQIVSPLISVERKIRLSSDLIPCSLCSGGHGKCLKFYLLWSDDGYIRVIGHICGQGFFGESDFQAMRSSAEQRLSHDVDERYVFAQLQQSAGWKADLEILTEHVREVAWSMEKLRVESPKLYRALKEAAKRPDKALVIVERAKASDGGMRTSSGVSNYSEKVISHLSGAGFLNRFSPWNELGRIEECIKGVVGTRTLPLTDDDVLDISISSPELIKAAADNIRTAHRLVIRLRERLSDSVKFFSRQNLDGISRWGKLQTGVRFSLEVRTDILIIRGMADGYAEIPIPRIFEAPALPTLGMVA